MFVEGVNSHGYETIPNRASKNQDNQEGQEDSCKKIEVTKYCTNL